MDQDNLKSAWLSYVSKGIEPTDGSTVRPVVLESWRRCRSANVDPWLKRNTAVLDDAQLAQRQETHKKTIEICLPYMESLYDFVQGSGFVISLTDSEGVLLKIIGDANIREQIRTGGFEEGADYSEKTVGTNAIGTALFLSEPIQIYSYEHYCRCAQVSTGSCALLRNEDNQVIGTISMVGYDYNVHSHTLGMTVAVADAIHNMMAEKRLQHAYKISDTYRATIMDCVSQGVLAVDFHGNLTHINRRAYRLLSLDSNKDYRNHPIREVLGADNTPLLELIEKRARITDKEFIIKTRRGAQPFAVTARLITPDRGNGGGVVIALDEIKRVKKIAQRISGAVASTSFDDLTGKSSQYKEMVRVAKNAALSDFNILLLGESGTGKDVFAQAIHNYSNRANDPFVAINCSAIPRELIASELFGYVEGAFTGARRGGSIGKFEAAEEGTIFLDEIGDMPLDLQGNLLRVIEERKVTRIGGHDFIPVNVRIIAATNRNLIHAINEGCFRQDLYYRLNVLTIHMVPLRERKEDIPLLAELLYKNIASNFDMEQHEIPSGVIEALCEYSFPGNIRELQNIIERTLVVSDDGRLKEENLPPEVRRGSTTGVRAVSSPFPSSIAKREAYPEYDELYSALMRNGGNISKTAKDYKVARSTLYRWMAKYGLEHTIGQVK